jgi:hypothetical protein
MWFVHGFVHGARSNSAFVRAARLVCDLDGDERAAYDQLSKRVRHLAVGLQVGLHVLLHRERHVRVADAAAERLPVDLRIAARSGLAVADVVQVDLRETGRRGELLEPSRDRIRMRRPAVLPAEQHAVIVVVGAEFPAAPGQAFRRASSGHQRERVERQDVLSVRGLAVRLDHPAVDNDPGGFYGERSGVQIE